MLIVRRYIRVMYGLSMGSWFFFRFINDEIVGGQKKSIYPRSSGMMMWRTVAPCRSSVRVCGENFQAYTTKSRGGGGKGMEVFRLLFQIWRDVREPSEQLKKKFQSIHFDFETLFTKLVQRPNQKTDSFPERKCL